MDLIDRIIAALLRLLVPQLPGNPEPRMPAFDPPMASSGRSVVEPPEPEPRRRPDPVVVDEIGPASFRDQLKATIRNTVVELAKAREEAFRAGVTESGGTASKGRRYADEDVDLAAWWNKELGKLLTLLDTTDLGQAVVAARAQSLIEREVVTQVQAAHTDGVVVEAQQRGLHLVLVPERDACLYCASFAGAIAAADAEFEPVRDFTVGEELVPGLPPLHPRCRCRVRAVTQVDADRIAVPLRREAERSVLRFESLPSESDRERTAAAKALIDAGTSLPKTVIERSGRAVRRREKEEPARKGS